MMITDKPEPVIYELTPGLTLAIEEDGYRSNKITLCGPLREHYEALCKTLGRCSPVDAIAQIHGETFTMEFSLIRKKMMRLALAGTVLVLNEKGVLTDMEAENGLALLELPEQDRFLERLKNERVSAAHRERSGGRGSFER